MSTTDFQPIDPLHLPWKTHPIIMVKFSDGTETAGHFSPMLDAPCFWEYRGIRQFNLVRRRTYLKRLTLPAEWRPFTPEEMSSIWSW